MKSRVRLHFGAAGSARNDSPIRARSFAAECVVATGTFTLELSPSAAPFQAMHVLAGAGAVRAFRRSAEPTEFAQGDTLLLPAGDEAYEVEPGANVVRAMVFRA